MVMAIEENTPFSIVIEETILVIAGASETQRVGL